MEYRDYYATLGVPRDASQADIKKQFRKAARKHHPDVNKDAPEAESRFKGLNEAYDVLSDPEKRKLYDQLGANWDSYQHGGAAGTAGADPFAAFRGGGGVRFEYQGAPEDLAGFSDFFRTFFAGGNVGEEPRARPRPRRAARSAAGQPTLEDMLGGMGGGFQGMHIDYGEGPGQPSRQVPMPSPEAHAEVTLEEVATGTERVVQIGERRLEVRIPAGVADGQRIRLPKTGTAGTPDSTLIVHVRNHRLFNRSGADLDRELAVTLAEALLGAEVPVETISGKTLLLRVPESTQNGRTFRLSGQGLPRFRAEGRGDLYARIRVVLPTGLDDEARATARTLFDHIDQPDPRHTGRRRPAAPPDPTDAGTPTPRSAVPEEHR
jgi:DnaJ-class molecular chaperone